MPWSSGYQLTVIGVREAAKVKVQSILQTKITDFNTVLQLSPLNTSSLTATTAHVIIGDPDTFAPASVTPFLFCVTGGGKHDSTDMEIEWRWIAGTNVTPGTQENVISTNISFYVHPDLFKKTTSTWADISLQAEYRERLRDRAIDWVRGDVFQTLTGVDMTLASQETQNAGDNLTKGILRRVVAGRFAKGMGGEMSVYGAQFHVEHTLN